MTCRGPERTLVAYEVVVRRRLLTVLPQVPERWELVIVNDGSRHRPGALADEFARSRPA